MRFDLVVIGGGLVGAGLVTALRHAGLNIALIDARLPSSDDPRLFALNHGSCEFLKNLGLWPQLEKNAAPIQQVHVSYQGHFGAVRLNREDVGLPTLGYVIPALHIEAAINAELPKLSCLTVFRPATLVALTQFDTHAQLVIDAADGQQTLEATIVIGADGTESTVRKLLNIPTKIIDYQQSALVTRTTLQRSHHHIAYERFTHNGAIAMLPLINNQCATIWSGETTEINRLYALSDAEFIRELQTNFGYRVGRLCQITKRYAFPLRMVRAEKAVSGCVMLLGNAAHTFHPIAAQGFNLALYEVATLVEAIQDRLTHGGSLKSTDLEGICETTQKQQATSIGVSHRLSKLFASNSRCFDMALQIGMVSLDLTTPIKKKFISGIMGRTGRVPSLLLSTSEL